MRHSLPSGWGSSPPDGVLQGGGIVLHRCDGVFCGGGVVLCCEEVPLVVLGINTNSKEIQI